jgi:hypothetical protein
MEINWSVVGWVAAIIFVYIFGIFEGRGQGRKRRIAEEQEEKKNQPASPPEAIQVDDPGLLRIKNENGVLSLDLDGTRVDGSSLSSNQRKRLIEVLNSIRPWLDAKPTPESIPQSAPDPTFESRLDAISAPPQANPQPVSVQPAPPAPSFVSTQDKPAAPVASKKKDDMPEAAPTSMVGQINAILQLRIANTNLSTQGVTLMESPSGGVNVYVGINKYEGIEDVPNEEVKAAIRSAISEWEKKYTPGLS